MNGDWLSGKTVNLGKVILGSICPPITCQISQGALLSDLHGYLPIEDLLLGDPGLGLLQPSGSQAIKQ